MEQDWKKKIKSCLENNKLPIMAKTNIKKTHTQDLVKNYSQMH